MNGLLEEFTVFDTSFWRRKRIVLATKPIKAVKELCYFNVKRNPKGSIIVTGKAGTFVFSGDYINYNVEKDGKNEK